MREFGKRLFRLSVRRDKLRTGTSVRRKAAHVAHTEEHFASADKRLSGVFFREKISSKKQLLSAYFAGTLSCENGGATIDPSDLTLASTSSAISIASR